MEYGPPGAHSHDGRLHVPRQVHQVSPASLDIEARTTNGIIKDRIPLSTGPDCRSGSRAVGPYTGCGGNLRIGKYQSFNHRARSPLVDLPQNRHGLPGLPAPKVQENPHSKLYSWLRCRFQRTASSMTCILATFTDHSNTIRGLDVRLCPLDLSSQPPRRRPEASSFPGRA